MSNPPVQPSPSNGSEPGESTPAYGQNAPQTPQTPQTPQFGQQTPPAYGQNAPQTPQYGQQTPPAYGQNAPQTPQYGQQTPPAYGQNAPQTPQYGQQTPPAYGQNAPQTPQYGQQMPPAYGQNAPQYGQSPYGAYPSEQPQPLPPTAAPQLVNTSFWLIVAAGAVWVISMLVSLGTLDSPAVRDLFEQQMATSGTKVDFESIKGFLIGTIVVFAVISAGLYALVALNVRKGKNWARILGTVFAALSIFNLFPLSLATLAALLGIAAIVLLYLPAASPYFQKRQPFANPYGQPGGPYGK
ncbi:hypothetical protein [Arthrobacter sp. NicSoilB8]|uniref:hypothetical protein n=1 Tax=Arthrobacter sp. NicSoilB8 TaxID=2830998 RepID=UPI001CC6140F|nr:hypothetical protein [Arthrobacter sp. NicSoilB8]BCW72650.1 hypothetical protein NicSoilB8_36940 [Arthrobacter sp. NicSoilB8]